MVTTNTVAVLPGGESDELPAQSAQTRLRPWVLLASMAAFFCLALEVDLLEHIDGISLYLKYSEVAVLAGIALVLVLLAAAAAWLCTLSLSQAAGLVPGLKKYKNAVAWYFGVGIGFCCLAYEVIGAAKVLFPRWQPSTLWQVLIIATLAVAVIGALKGSIDALQHFGVTRLVPISLVHSGVAILTLLLLISDHTHFFHDYAPAGHATGAQSPDIYLITIDALSADHTSLYGYSLPTTPHLERFAQTSYTFDSFFSNSNFTTPSTASIVTGKLPWSHRVFQFSGFLRGSAQNETLTTLLRQRGYYTAIISSNYAATPILQRIQPSYDAVEYVPPLGFGGYWFRLTNFVGSKRQYVLDAALPNRVGLVRFLSDADALIFPFRYPSPGEPVFDQARTLLERSDIPQPLFVWTHILPPHDPYLAPAPFRDRFAAKKGDLSSGDFLKMQSKKTLPPGVSRAELRARYDEMVLYADDVVGHYLDWLEQSGRLDRSIVIISADHGESFEHGMYFHGGPNLDNDVIRIPLVIHLPGQKLGARISQPAQQADLLPTILDLLGGTPPDWTDGESIKAALEGKSLPDRYLFSMNLELDRIFNPISNGTLAVMDGEFKYVIRLDTHQEFLYRYKIDGRDQRNLIALQPDVAKRLHDVLFTKLREVNERPALKP
ncbi:MAG: sulfatase [Candidatus Sulfotelmatobacter sp.]